MPKITDDAMVFRVVVETLVKSGYARTTTSYLAQQAGINEATLFRKYGSKDQLICQAANHVFARVPLAKLVFTGNLREDLISLVSAYIETAGQYGPFVHVLLIELSRYRGLAAAMDSIKNNIGRITRILQRHIDEGRLKGGNGARVLAVLLGPLFIVASSSNSDLPQPGFPQPKEYVENFLTGYEIQ